MTSDPQIAQITQRVEERERRLGGCKEYSEGASLESRFYLCNLRSLREQLLQENLWTCQ